MQSPRVMQDKTQGAHLATIQKTPIPLIQISKVFYFNPVLLDSHRVVWLNRMCNLARQQRRRQWIWVSSSNSQLWHRKQGIATNHLIRILKIWVEARWVLVALIKTLSTDNKTAKKQTTDNKIVLTSEVEVELWRLSSNNSNKA